MKYIELANQLIPSDIPVHEIPLRALHEAGRLPNAAFWPDSKGEYSAGIIVPKMNIEESISELKKWLPNDPYTYLSIENLLKDNNLLHLEESMSPQLFAIYSIYHELGHWYDFQDRYRAAGLTGKHYYNDYKKHETWTILAELKEEIVSKTKGSQEKENLLTLYHQTYRQHPFEQIADQYAINKMREQNQKM